MLPSYVGIRTGDPLHVTAEASVDVTAPSIDLALYYTGDWENALGINGLTQQLAHELGGGVEQVLQCRVLVDLAARAAGRAEGHERRDLDAEDEEDRPLSYMRRNNPS